MEEKMILTIIEWFLSGDEDKVYKTLNQYMREIDESEFPNVVKALVERGYRTSNRLPR